MALDICFLQMGANISENLKMDKYQAKDNIYKNKQFYSKATGKRANLLDLWKVIPWTKSIEEKHSKY